MNSRLIWLHGVISSSAVWATVLFAIYTGPREVAPIEISEAERTAPYIQQPTVPMNVDLRILSPGQFDTEKISPNTTAWTNTFSDGSHRCQITLRAGAMIDANPSTRLAFWHDRSDGDEIAHELLHCIRGSWHPLWDDQKVSGR